MYTSGSTGKPKGCYCVDTLELSIEYYGAANMSQSSNDDKVLQKTTFTFDVSIWEFFWPID